MLGLILLRLLAPGVFRMLGWLALTFFLITVLAISSGVIDHGRNQPTQHYDRVEGTR